jgi:hypothetical protein
VLDHGFEGSERDELPVHGVGRNPPHVVGRVQDLFAGLSSELPERYRGISRRDVEASFRRFGSLDPWERRQDSAHHDPQRSAHPP